METSFRNQGKISKGLGGVGTVTEQMVTRRAREIAVINGRNGNDFTEDDRRLAQEELVGAGSDQEPGQDTPLVGSSAWEGNPGTSGRQSPKVNPRDEQSEAEKMVEDGAQEAEHDTMLKASGLESDQK